MEELYQSFALISCGVSLAMGSVYLYLGVLRKSGTYSLFGLMGFVLFIFYLMPPTGFILIDNPPYDSPLLLKRIFIFLYYGLTPWFILAYSGYPKKWPAYFLTTIAIISYGLMAFTQASPEKPFWAKFALINFGGIFVLGMVCARWLQIQAQRRAAVSLYSVMLAYAGLLILTVFNQLSDGALSDYFNLKLFFPMHFHSLFFMMVMGQHLVLDLSEKTRLEESLAKTESRWKSFMTNSPLIIFELDHEGRIVFINDFGAKFLGYDHPCELHLLNWFDHFVRPTDKLSMKELYAQLMSGHNTPNPKGKSVVKVRNGETAVISWSTFVLSDTAGHAQNVMCIGRNITDEEKASKLVDQLKSELLKEQLPVVQRRRLF